MTAREAARRMGVRVETLYAYVSRGLIESHPAPDGRSSLFDARAIEELARRGRPRQSSRSTSLNMLIETSLTSLSERGVRYRGVLAADLARTHTFEQVAELLWLGAAPERHVVWHGDPVALPPRMSAVAALRVIVATTMAQPPLRDPVRPASPAWTADAGRRLIATMVDSLPVAGDGRTPRLRLPAAPNGADAVRATIAGRLWARLSPRRPAPGMLAVLNAALVLMADHELAASTLGVRVAASTWAEPGAVVLAGLGVLSGPLHGGASRSARAMLEAAAEAGAARAVTQVMAGGGRVPGFGHRVYVGPDPRATVMLDLLRDAGGASRTAAIVHDVEEEVRRRIGREPNVDFALAAMTMAAGMPSDAGEATMAVARTAGWLAHAIEEYRESPLRFRPRASYIGP